MVLSGHGMAQRRHADGSEGQIPNIITEKPMT